MVELAISRAELENYQARMATSRLEEAMSDLTRFQDERASSIAEVKISHA